MVFPSRVNRFLLAKSAVSVAVNDNLCDSGQESVWSFISVSVAFRRRLSYLEISITAFRYLTCCKYIPLTAASVTLIIEIRKAYELYTIKSQLPRVIRN